MSSNQTPSIAFILSLIAGILMLVGGIITSAWFMSGGYTAGYNTGYYGMMGNGMMGGFGGMMNGYQSMMHSFGVPLGYMSGLSIIGLVAGILVTVGAVMLNARPRESTTWGVIILVFSIISLLGMGGFYVGALLGIAGGALALSFRPSSRETSSRSA